MTGRRDTLRATDRDEILQVLRAFDRDGLDYVLIVAADPNIDEIRAEDLLGDYPAVRYYPPSGDLYFDVMTRLGELVSFETIAQEDRDVEGIRVRVATPAALYRMKKATVRPLDRQDAEALRRRFDLREE